MTNRNYKITISPEDIKNKIFYFPYSGDPYNVADIQDPCCPITAQTHTLYTTGTTGYIYSLSDLVTGNTGNTSLLTGLTIPILITEKAVDMGYYTPFDGLIYQKEVVNNFIISGDPSNPYTAYFYNTSDISFTKFVSMIVYRVSWGDGTPIQTITNFTPNSNSHVYANNDTFTISLSAFTPWGITVVEKPFTTPVINVIPTNTGGTITFIPSGGNWSGITTTYDYISPLDAIQESSYQSTTNFGNYTSVPFYITGYTQSTLNDIKQYGTNPYPPVGIQVTGDTGVIGTYWGVSPDGLYVSYTINDVDYYDYKGFTIFSVLSSGLTESMLVSSGLTKNETLLNVVMEPEIQSNVFVERGKNSALERIERLGEVDNLGDLIKYGYGFFNIVTTQ